MNTENMNEPPWKGCKVKLKSSVKVQGLKHDKTYKVVEDLDSVIELATPLCIDSRHLKSYFELAPGEVPKHTHKVIQKAEPKEDNPYAIPEEVREKHIQKESMKALEETVRQATEESPQGEPIGFDIVSGKILYEDKTPAPEERPKTKLPPSPLPEICKETKTGLMQASEPISVTSSPKAKPVPVQASEPISVTSSPKATIAPTPSGMELDRVTLEKTPEGSIIATGVYLRRFSAEETKSLMEDAVRRKKFT
jgi:hypothetical protein